MTSISMKVYSVASCPLRLFSVSAYFISIARYHPLSTALSVFEFEMPYIIMCYVLSQYCLEIVL